MTGPNAASQRLRDSVAALPEPIRTPWLHFADQVYVEHNGNDHVFAWTDVNRTTSPAGNAETATHIATTSSPPTVLLVAEHLATVDRCLRSDPQPCDHEETDECLEAIAHTADALASAILHTNAGDDHG